MHVGLLYENRQNENEIIRARFPTDYFSFSQTLTRVCITDSITVRNTENVLIS